MAQEDLTLNIRVLGMSEVTRAANALKGLGAHGARGARQLAKDGQGAADAVHNIGRQGKFAQDVLQAFVLYKGFVVLKDGATAALRELIELEKQVAIVTTQLNGLESGAKRAISQELLTMSGDLAIRASRLAEAQFEIVSANIELADSFRILELTAKASIAGNLTDPVLAFNSALSQANVFGEDFNAVFDKQFNLVKRGIFTYEQLATVVGTVAVSAGRAGQDLSTTNAALAALSQVLTGKQLERGATGLRNALEQIATESDKIAEVFGVVTVDTEGNFRNLVSIIRDLKAASEGLSESDLEERIKEAFPDIRESLGITTLMKTLPQFEQFLVDQEFAVGSLDEAHAKVNDTLASQAVIMGNEVIPAFDFFTDGLKGSITAVNELNDLVPGLTAGLIQMALAAAAVQGAFAFGPGALAGIGRMRASLRPGIGITSGAAIQGPVPLGGFGLGVGPRSMTGNLRGIGTIAGVGAVGGAAFGSPLGGAIAGGSFGALGGIQGAAIGAAVGGLAGFITEEIKKGFGESADDVALTFAERFEKELVQRSGDIAAAFLAATASGATSSPTTAGLRQLISQTSGLAQATRVKENATKAMGGGQIGGFFGSIAGMVATGSTVAAEIDATVEGRDIPKLIDRITDAYDQFSMQVDQIPEFATAQQKATAASILLAQSVEDNIDVSDDNAEQVRQLITLLDQYGVTTEEARRALEIFRDEGATAFINFLLSTQKAAETIQSASEDIRDIKLPSNSLAETLLEASVAVRSGLIESTEFTADELEMLGEEFRELNRLVRARSILEELEAISKLAGFNNAGVFTQAFQSLMNDFVAGGRNLKDVLSDPKKLADFVSGFEFGDIKIDQSTDNNFIIRVSGDVSPAQIAALQQSIVDGVNQANREAQAR